MSDEIEIPPSAWQLKADFPVRPSDEVVAEIKLFIKTTGTPHLWRGHTHSPPAKNATIVYLDEVSLPPSHSGELNHNKWAPCPVCSPRHPKYFKSGMIAWFPDEKVIRIIGPECFASFNLEGHTAAYAAFRKEQERKQTENFLIAHLPSVAEFIDAIDGWMPTVKEVDRVREIIARRLPLICDFDFWHHLRADPRLKLETTLKSIHRDRNGEEREVTVREMTGYGPVIGHILLQPKAKPIFDRLDICRTRLKAIDYGNTLQSHLASISSEEKKKLAKFFQKEVRKVRDLFSELEEVRLFLRVENIATFRGWGRHQDSPTRLYIAFEPGERQLRIGRTDESYQTMTVRTEFWTVLRSVPDLMNSSAISAAS